jgi:hypothetical protein
MSDLLALADRVEAGEDVAAEIVAALQSIPTSAIEVVDHDYGHCWRVDEPDDFRYEEIPAYTSSLDAAKALHDAVLGPKWLFVIGHRNATVYMALKSYGANNCPPAVAWVSCILRAKAGEQDNA